ncbi:MAG: M16 family metallopeptidase, partial [Opitutales bacterium]
MNGFQRTLRALALAGGFLCLTTTLAQEPAPEGLVADPTVTFGTLDNGLTYAIMPNEEPPERVSLRLLVRAGSLQETDEQAGLAHFLEHMAFNGSENYAPGELVEYLQRLGMGFGADTNAHTGFNETVYKLELPENSEDYLSEGLQVLSDYAGGLLLLPEEIESERGVIKAELRARDSVGYRTFVSSWNFLLPESRLVNRFPIGEIEVIENAGRDAFVDYYETWYRPDHMAVVVVGEVEPAEIEGMIAEFFADLETPANDVPRIDMGPITNPGLSVGVHAEPEAPATEVALYSLRPFDRGPDSRERRIRRIREGLANAVVSQRLERIARAEGAPISAGVAYAWDYLDYMDVSGIDVTAKPGQWKEAVAVMDEELRRALAFGFQPAELEEAIANRRRAARQAVDTQGTRKSRQLSSALVSALSEERTFLSPEAQLALVEDAINDFGVDEAAETFRALWADDDRFLWMTGPLEAPGDG